MAKEEKPRPIIAPEHMVGAFFGALLLILAGGALTCITAYEWRQAGFQHEYQMEQLIMEQNRPPELYLESVKNTARNDGYIQGWNAACDARKKLVDTEKEVRKLTKGQTYYDPRVID